MNDTAAIIGLISIIATSVGFLIWIAKYLMIQMRKTLDANTKALALNTKATQSADKYLRERNGRDNEFHKEVLKGLKDIQNQHVQTQKVEHQTIQKQD